MDSVVVHLAQGGSELQAKDNLISALGLTLVPLISSNAGTAVWLGGNREAGENSGLRLLLNTTPGLHPSVC